MASTWNRRTFGAIREARASSFLLRPFMAVKKTISASVMDRQIYHFFFMSSSSFLYDFAICNYCLLCYNLNELTPQRDRGLGKSSSSCACKALFRLINHERKQRSIWKN